MTVLFDDGNTCMNKMACIYWNNPVDNKVMLKFQDDNLDCLPLEELTVKLTVLSTVQ